MKRLFTLVAAMLLLSVSVSAETVSRIAAVVNDEIITTYQLEKAVQERLKGQEAPADAESLRREVLSELIDEALISGRIRELGLTADDEEVEAAIEDVLLQNKMTRDQLVEALEYQGMSFDLYRENLRKQILRFKLYGSEVQKKVQVTNKEIRDYFQEHIEDYREKATIDLSYIAFFFPEKATAEQKDLLRQKAEEAVHYLGKGEGFEETLGRFGADAAVRGGGLDKVVEEELNPYFASAVRELQDGAVSSPVETPEAYYVLKVVSRNPGTVASIEEVKEEIREILFNSNREERFRQWNKKLKEEAQIDIRI